MPFLAVAMTVALPDICCSLSSPDGRTSAEAYKKWCVDNLPSAYFGFVTGADLYSMRCGVLHNGRFGDLKHNVERVIFMLPGSGTFENCQFGEAYCYSVVGFCQHFADAVFHWMEGHKHDPVVEANIPRLMQYRQGGMAPYIVGTTVLA